MTKENPPQEELSEDYLDHIQKLIDIGQDDPWRTISIRLLREVRRLKDELDTWELGSRGWP